MISTWPKTAKVRAFLASEFQRDVFAAAIKSFEQLDNPLRLNNLATGLRELIRIMLRHLAPDDETKACGWYRAERDHSGRPIITRSQRIQYAVQAGLPEAFVRDTLRVDVPKVKRDVVKLVERLSKFTHIEPATFGVEGSEAEREALKALETFSLLYETIAECRAEVVRAVEERVREALDDELTSTVVQELDELATHYIVWSVDIDTVRVTTLNATRIEVAASGSVNCEFQYGSSSDVRRGDGAVSEGSYPVKSRFEAPATTPLDLHIVRGTLIIDNSSFFD